MRSIYECSDLRGNHVWHISALESALGRHASGTGSGGGFTGKGRTIGGSSSNTSGNPAPQAGGGPFENLDPKVKILLGLFGAYLLFWYLS